MITKGDLYWKPWWIWSAFFDTMLSGWYLGRERWGFSAMMALAALAMLVPRVNGELA